MRSCKYREIACYAGEMDRLPGRTVMPPVGRNSVSVRSLLIHSASPLLFHNNPESLTSVISTVSTVFHPNTATPAKNFGHHAFYVEVIYIPYPVKNAYVFPTSPCISVKSWNPENTLPDTVLARLLN